MDARTNSGARDASAGPGRATARQARAGGQLPRTRIMDSDFKLGFKFRVTVTVTARFKFLRVSRDGHTVRA